MVDDGEGVTGREGAVVFGRGLEAFAGDAAEFGDPLADVGAVGVIGFGLGPGVLDAEVGGGVGAGAGAPLPAAVVGGVLAIDKVLHEEAFAEAPVAVQILGEEHGDDHADAVVHETGVEEFANAGVDDGEAGAALGPGEEVVVGAGPGDAAPVGVEFFVKDFGMIDEDSEVELTPGEFFDVGFDGVAGGGRGVFGGLAAALVEFADAEQAEAEVLAEAGSGLAGRKVAFVFVTVQDAGVDEMLHALAGGALAGFEHAGDIACEAPVIEGGDGEGGEGGGGAKGGDAWEGRSFGEAEPVAAVRGVDAVFGAGAGEDFGGFMEDAVFVVVALDAEFLAAGQRPPAPLLQESA